MELNRTRKFAVSSLLAAIAFLFISVWGFQQRSEAIKRAREADSSREEAEYRKKEADSLRILAEGRASIADMQKMMAQLNADSADKERAIAYLQSKISEQEKEIAYRQAEEFARKSETYQQAKEKAEKTAEQAIEQQNETEKEKFQELRKKMISIAQTMAVKTTQTDDKNLRGLLAYQAFLFNRDYEGQNDHPDIYNALYSALAGFYGDNYNSLVGHAGSVKSIAFVPGSAVFYSSGVDGKILRWDLNGNIKSYRTLRSNPFNRCMVISPNGRWLANATPTSGIQLFNLNTSNEPELLQGHKSSVGVLAFTSDSKGLYSASNDKTIMYWDLVSGANEVFLNLPNTNIRCLAVSPVGRYLYGGTDDGRLVRWNMDTKEETVLFRSDKNTIAALSVNSAGNRIAFVDKNGSLRLWDTRSNNVIRTVAAHAVRIMDVKFSPDDKQIATSSLDKTVKIWDAANLNNKPITINKHNDWVIALAFSPDGKFLVSSGEDGTIYYWPAHASYMAEQMCGKITRNFTQREWETYVSYDINYQKTCPNK
jgi:dipeptidyl aminopeptidase/acylaminoacyl peptidase